MRGIFGLVSLLVVIGIMVLIFKMVEVPTIERGKTAHDEAQQISGRGEDGRSAIGSFKIDPQLQGSKLKALVVTDVTPGGAVDKYYGLKTGDKIVEIETNAGLQRVSEASNDDPEMAKDQVQEAFQGSRAIVVERNGLELTLPASAASALTNAPGANPSASQSQSQAQPGQTPSQPPAERTNVHSQVDNIIKGIPGQK